MKDYNTISSTYVSYCIVYDLAQVTKTLTDGHHNKYELETIGLCLSANQIHGYNETVFLDEDFKNVSRNISMGNYNNPRQAVIDIGNGENPLKKFYATGILAGQKKIDFALPEIIKANNLMLFDEYASLLYRFANIIAKANNQINADEEKKLRELYDVLHNRLPQEVNKNLKVYYSNSTLEDVQRELDELIGLESIKQEVNTLINFIKVQHARKQSGLESTNISYHMVFTGNPGTGKTTVARIIAKAFKALGILSHGHLVETDRSGLVGEYIGQTAIKTNNTIDSAINGVLFIDEAYALSSQTINDFGKEAIATMVKRMEDDRDKLVVILAGYTGEIKEFMELNPGFKSRINRYLEFPDYTPDELLQIFQSQCAKLEYKLTEDARKYLQIQIMMAYGKRDQTFGNGRYIRNIFEKALERQANRIAGITNLSKEILTTFTIEDLGGKESP